MSDQKRVEINIENFGWGMLFISIALVILSIIIGLSVYYHKKNIIISQATSCYSKVLIEDWQSDAAEIMALQACQSNQIAQNKEVKENVDKSA